MPVCMCGNTTFARLYFSSHLMDILFTPPPLPAFRLLYTLLVVCLTSPVPLLLTLRSKPRIAATVCSTVLTYRPSVELVADDVTGGHVLSVRQCTIVISSCLRDVTSCKVPARSLSSRALCSSVYYSLA